MLYTSVTVCRRGHTDMSKSYDHEETAAHVYLGTMYTFLYQPNPTQPMNIGKKGLLSRARR